MVKYIIPYNYHCKQCHKLEVQAYDIRTLDTDVLLDLKKNEYSAWRSAAQRWELSGSSREINALDIDYIILFLLNYQYK